MDAISAAAITSLLINYGRHLAGVASEVVDEGVRQGLRALWEKVRDRFSSDPQASGALDRLAEQPGNQRRQAAVEDHLDEVLSADADFAASLSELVERMKATGRHDIQVRDSGAVAIGGNVSIKGTRQVAGRDITISAPGK
ncbi:hypothetical protein [Amycolatopsis azurea]|uniref:Uncharacterized protein n=1 Tax=Amycolatopsis azurea DSM 43854 TaxID=1238180 RepID=M2PX59_9PSEU|nr:hypothetical protein [Amycolatopsis azurea]EMD24215.1 hypothetical protein C791_6293 [Amycolatopsis azurea DSM 43854]OOC07963.1 hypothetical protein B0293_03495 [Amycolatopsis azurea DSM 43854]